MADEKIHKEDGKKQQQQNSSSSRTAALFSQKSLDSSSNKINETSLNHFSPEQNDFGEVEKSWNEMCKEHRSANEQPNLTRSSSSIFSDPVSSPSSQGTSTPHDGVMQHLEKTPAHVVLNSESTIEEFQTWLRQNNFEKWLNTFEHYSGAEVFLLGKEDFMKICGVAEGIRMFYKICTGIGPSTKKSLYVSYMAGTKRKLYMRKNFSMESLESPSPTYSSVSSTVTTGSCSNLLANTIGDMSLDHQQQVRTIPTSTTTYQNDGAVNLNNSAKKGSKRSRKGSETISNMGLEDEDENDFDLPHSKKNRYSDGQDIELPVYRAVHLQRLTYSHLIEKLSEAFNIPLQYINHVYLVDRDGTDIHFTDEIVERLKSHSIFTMDVISDGSPQKKILLLIPLCQKE